MRRINPETARQAGLEYLKSNGGKIAQAARAFGINRPVVYDILRKRGEGDLTDRSKAPHRQPRKTPPQVAEKVIQARNKTRIGPERLSLHLSKYAGVTVPPGTIRHILRRNKEKITGRLPARRRPKEQREFVDWYRAQPFEIVCAC